MTAFTIAAGVSAPSTSRITLMVPGPGAAPPSAGPAPMGGVTPADEVLLRPTETTAATLRSPSDSTAQRANSV